MMPSFGAFEETLDNFHYFLASYREIVLCEQWERFLTEQCSLLHPLAPSLSMMLSLMIAKLEFVAELPLHSRRKGLLLHPVVKAGSGLCTSSTQSETGQIQVDLCPFGCMVLEPCP